MAIDMAISLESDENRVVVVYCAKHRPIVTMIFYLSDVI